MPPMKRYLPTRQQLKETKALKFLGNRIFEPNLWHFNRYSLSFASLIGGICCFLPIPFQLIPAVVLCLWLRCNVPVAVAVVWISNPITMGPMMYFAYLVGTWILGVPEQPTPADPTPEWFTQQLSGIWQPLIVGCLACGFTLGIAGFTAVRVYYRWRVTRYKQRKQAERRQPGNDDRGDTTLI